MGPPDPRKEEGFSWRADPPSEHTEWKEKLVLACRLFLIVSLILIPVLVIGTVQSQSASLLSFLPSQDEGQREQTDQLNTPWFSSSVFCPSPAPSPLPSPVTAFSEPHSPAPPALTHKPLPHIPSTAVDFLRPRPPLGVAVVINLNKQRLTVTRYDKVILESPISSGRPSHPSATGNFEVTQKNRHHYSNL
ncbi:MAG: hypothetical protein C5B47_02695, partial [Verrucomicrobia bacterium]